MVERDVVIKNRAGMHARPAALLVQTANKFSSNIYFKKDSEQVNGKSIMGIITLGATYNTELKIIADGKDEIEAVEALAGLFENKFEEE
ncbi:MAG TPA: HPr family phosphocarrier protein [Spirochaetales bacterium]|nr:HPr family phosphocarrier protein [Spirochaetales bacterium]